MVRPWHPRLASGLVTDSLPRLLLLDIVVVVVVVATVNLVIKRVWLLIIVC